MSAPQDPWKRFRDALAANAYNEHSRKYLREELDELERSQAAARAAVDARHQAEIAAKDETIGRWRQTGLTLMKFFAPFPVMNESDMPEFLWREVPTLIRSERKEIATLRATVEQQATRITALEQALNELLDAVMEEGCKTSERGEPDIPSLKRLFAAVQAARQALETP